MELYDEEMKPKKSKVPVIIEVCIVLLVLMTILVVIGILYLKDSITTVKINGVKNIQIEPMLYIDTTEDGKEQLYMPIIKIAKHLGYEGFIGDYTNKSEDNTKCYVTCENEAAVFIKDSKLLIKVSKDSEYEYIQLDEPIIDKDGELYTTIEGIEKAFNVLFFSDEKFKNIDIYSMDFLVNYYATKLQIDKYSENFADKKAILEDMMIIEDNKNYGVINVQTHKFILESKYEEIKYLPVTSDFIIKSNGKYGVIAKDKTVKVKAVYDEIKVIDNKNGLYLVKQNNAYGVIDINGNVIIASEYKQIGINNVEKYSQNGVENKYILLDEIIPIKNDKDLWGFFNIKGEKVIDFKYSDVGCQLTPVSNSYPVVVIPSYKVIVVKNDKNYNLVTIDGEELVTGNILGAVYLKLDTASQQNKFFMTSSNNTKVINIEEWLASIGR